MDLHINYCKTFGISEQEIQATEELQGTLPTDHRPLTPRTHCFVLACTAYTRYVLDVGQSEDWLALQMALAPCLLGYGAVAQMLAAHPATVRDTEANTYWPWIENYGAADYVEAVRLGSGTYLCQFPCFLFSPLFLLRLLHAASRPHPTPATSRPGVVEALFLHASCQVMRKAF